VRYSAEEARHFLNGKQISAIHDLHVDLCSDLQGGGGDGRRHASDAATESCFACRGNLKTVFTSKSQLMGTVVPLPQYESTTASSLRLLFSRNPCEPGLKPPRRPAAANSGFVTKY
jgi:hypothetical protein